MTSTQLRTSLSIIAVTSMMTFATTASTQSQVRTDDSEVVESSPLTDELFIYRGTLTFRDAPLDGFADLEFHLYARETDTTPIAPAVFADEWPVVDGRVWVGLDLAGEADPVDGAWLEISVDGTVLSPRKYIAPRGWAIRGDVSRERGRAAQVVSMDDAADTDGKKLTDESSTDDNLIGDSLATGEGTTSRSLDRSMAPSGKRSVLNGVRTGESNTLRGGNGNSHGSGDSLSGGSGGDFLFNFGDRFFNSTDSVYVNIDSNNDDSDTRLFEIATDRSGDVGGTSLFRVNEDGKVGIGTTQPVDSLHVNGILRVGGHEVGQGGADGDYMFLQPNSPGLATFRFHQANLRFQNSNYGEVMRLTRNGHVGIGTTSPAYPLHIQDAQPYTQYDDTGGGSSWVVGVQGPTVGFNISELGGDYRLVINDGGNVGIGTYSASAKLDVYKNESNGAAGIASINAGTGYAGYFSTTNGSNTNAALYCTTDGSGPAILANTGTSGIGVHGIGGRGVYGYSELGTGVYARSDAEQGDGLFARVTGGPHSAAIATSSSAGAWGALFGQSIHVDGNIHASGSKNFIIDNPLNPSEEYLFHSCIESDEMKNVYDGVVVLDENGEAEVTLPDWFDLVNANFRYQLSCIGGHAPVYIGSEIEDNRFAIAGGRAGLKVSWQVTGVRVDPAALAADFQVIRAKHEADRGTYLFPQGYGQPQSMKATRIANPNAN